MSKDHTTVEPDLKCPYCHGTKKHSEGQRRMCKKGKIGTGEERHQIRRPSVEGNSDMKGKKGKKGKK